MPKFILIDQSLKAVGGHHYDYAMHVCRAAQASGYQVVLATHRRFRLVRSRADDWQLQPCFSFTTYSRHASYESGRSRPRQVSRTNWPLGWPNSLRRVWFGFDRQRRIASFQRACRQVVQGHRPQASDIVFLPTVSEFDFEALAGYLSSDATSLPPSWHVQFHYSFSDDTSEGRGESFAAVASQAEQKGKVIQRIAQQLTKHRIRYYAVTEQLAAEYQRWTGVAVQPLAWPINPKLIPAPLLERKPNAKPLRAVVAGAIRDEKGYAEIVTLVRAMMAPASPLRGLSLVLQCNKPGYRRQLRSQCLDGIPDPVLAREQFDTLVTFPEHPLSEADYAAMIVGADLGILLYDRQRYAIRRAGVLGEFLAAGVPVLVPADCWLSRQVAETNYRYLDDVYADATRCVGSEQTYCPEESGSPIRVSISPGASHVMISLSEPSGEPLLLRFRDDQGQPVSDWTVRMDPRCERLPLRYLTKVPDAAPQLELRLPDRISCRVSFHRAGPKGGLPLSANSLAFADKSQCLVLLADLLQHHDHYRHHSIRFSHDWRMEHDPAETVRQLTMIT